MPPLTGAKVALVVAIVDVASIVRVTPFGENWMVPAPW
jgi:hypothetical protein